MNPLVVNVVSLGCAKNLVDTEVMCGAIASSGMYLSESPDDANVCLINTCSFIKDARDEAEEAIRTALKWKRAGRGAKRLVVVAGCLPQRFPAETARQFPGIDLLLGLDDVPHAAELIQAAFAGKARHEVDTRMPTYLYDHTTPRLTVTPPAYAYLKIAEGCDHRCAFCAIPTFRGNQRSRSISSVVTECRQLLDQGARELNLIAQDTSRYGLDRNDQANIVKLLKECDTLDGDFWLRILYTHPLHTSDELLDVLAHSRHVVPYLDMPIQHLSTHVLQDMRRGMTGPQLRERLTAIRHNFPQLTFRTTVLVGFPGETEDDFKELSDFLAEFKFDRLGAFAFSPEDGTPAQKLDLPVPPAEIAAQRRDLILALQAEISTAKNRQLLNSTQRVLLEEQLDDTTWLARTAADAPEVDQQVTVKTKRRKNTQPRFANVKITRSYEYDLEATEI